MFLYWQKKDPGLIHPWVRVKPTAQSAYDAMHRNMGIAPHSVRPLIHENKFYEQKPRLEKRYFTQAIPAGVPSVEMRDQARYLRSFMNLQNKKQMSDEELMLEAEISEVYDRIRRVDILIKMIETQIHSYEEAQQIDKAVELRTTLEQMNSIKSALLNKYTEVMSKAGRVMYQKYIPQQEQVGNLGLAIDNKNEKKKKKTVDDIVKAINSLRLPGEPDKNIAVPAIVDDDHSVDPSNLNEQNTTELAIALGKDIAFLVSETVRAEKPKNLKELQSVVLSTHVTTARMPKVLQNLAGTSLIARNGSTTIKSYLGKITNELPTVTQKTLDIALNVMEGTSDSLTTNQAILVLLCYEALTKPGNKTRPIAEQKLEEFNTASVPSETDVKDEEVKGEGMFVPRIHSMVLPIGTRFRDDADVSVTEKDEAYQQNVEQRQQLYREYYKKLYGKEPSSDDVKQAFPENVEPIKKRFRLA